MDSYFVIGCSADGMTFDGPLAKHELAQRLDSGYYNAHPRFVTSTPKPVRGGLGMREGELFIIQGRAVTPLPKETVTHWEVP